MKYPRSWQVVRSADQPKDRCHDALPDHHCRSVHVDVCVCAGGCACSKVFVDATFFAFGRPPLTCRSPQCTGAARTRRPGFAAGASTLLTVPHALILGATLGERPILSTSRRNVELLKGVGAGHGQYALIVSSAAQAVRAHATRYRAPPVYGSQNRRSEPDFADL